MSERIPMGEDIRQALKNDGWTLDEADEGIARVKAEGAVEALKRLEFECKSVALSIGGHNLNGAVTLRDTARTVAAFRARIEKEAGL